MEGWEGVVNTSDGGVGESNGGGMEESNGGGMWWREKMDGRGVL